MKLLFALVGMASLTMGIASCAMAKGAIHEGVGAVMTLTGIVSLGVAAVLEVIEAAVKAIIDAIKGNTRS